MVGQPLERKEEQFCALLTLLDRLLLCFGIKSKGFLTKNDPKVLSPAPAVVDFQLDCGGWSCDCGGLALALNYVRRVPDIQSASHNS